MMQEMYLKNWGPNIASKDNYHIILSDSAKEDLDKIYKYISESLIEKNTAERIISNIEDNILRLEEFPYSCPEINIKPHNDIVRKLIIDNYLVLYDVNEEKMQVNIYNVVYNKSDYLS